jgi:hypothetical protein
MTTEKSATARLEEPVFGAEREFAMQRQLTYDCARRAASVALQALRERKPDTRRRHHGDAAATQRLLEAERRDRQLQRDESERQRLQAILEEHRRDNPRKTMLALAWTIHELRGNFEQLSRVIGPAVEGKGHIGLWPHGPHKAQQTSLTDEQQPTAKQGAHSPHRHPP